MKAPHLLQKFVRSILDRSPAAKKRSRPRLCGFEPLEPRMVLSAAMPLSAPGNSGLHRNDWRHVEAKSHRSEVEEVAPRPQRATGDAIHRAAERAERTPRQEPLSLAARSEAARSDYSLEQTLKSPAKAATKLKGEGEDSPQIEPLRSSLPPVATPTLRPVSDTISAPPLEKQTGSPLETLTTSQLRPAREGQDAPPLTRQLEQPFSFTTRPAPTPVSVQSTMTVLGPVVPATLVVSVASATAPYVVVPVAIPVTIQLTYTVPVSVSRPSLYLPFIPHVVNSVAIQPAISLVISRFASGRWDGPTNRGTDPSLFTAEYIPAPDADETSDADFVRIDESSGARRRAVQTLDSAASEDQPLEASPTKESGNAADEESGMIELESDGSFRHKRRLADRSSSADFSPRLTPLAELPLVHQAAEFLRELLQQAANDSAASLASAQANTAPVVDDGLIEVLAADVGRQATPRNPESAERAASLEAGAALYQAFEVDMTEVAVAGESGPAANSQVAVSHSAERAALAE
jgi:hypothetical protein